MTEKMAHQDTKCDENVGKVRVVNGNLLDAKEFYVGHQCNCVTTKGAHLSADVFARFPHADIYKTRKGKDVPGTIVVKGNESKCERMVINMLAQYYPDKSKYNNDSYPMHEAWFQICLNQIAKIPNIKDLALPYNIGCGAAGGSWPRYQQFIESFAQKHPHIKITLYKIS
jgi:hypothetical protein